MLGSAVQFDILSARSCARFSDPLSPRVFPGFAGLPCTHDAPVCVLLASLIWPLASSNGRNTHYADLPSSVSGFGLASVAATSTTHFALISFACFLHALGLLPLPTACATRSHRLGVPSLSFATAAVSDESSFELHDCAPAAGVAAAAGFAAAGLLAAFGAGGVAADLAFFAGTAGWLGAPLLPPLGGGAGSSSLSSSNSSSSSSSSSSDSPSSSSSSSSSPPKSPSSPSMSSSSSESDSPPARSFMSTPSKSNLRF
mmetsp:Transcript_165/g.516  ORF Transcript_165/g.516 Transcript_165/m.516 type:complete len:257 (+) Transcript_165:37-807(+)